MANEQTVKIPVSLEVIDSSVQNIKDILGKMKPDSTGFKQLSKIMDDLVKSSGKIQASFERGFSSNSEIKAAEKEIRNVEAAMENLQRLGANISFKDIKLDANQQKTFDDLEQKLNIAKKHYSDLLKSFNNKENSEAIKLVDKDLALRSFDEIKEKLTSTINDMTTKAETLQGVFGRLGEQIKKVTESQTNGTYKSGDAIKNIIGEDAYKDFFLNGKNGLRFNGTKVSGKGGAKEAFINYLKESFTLTEDDMARIRSATSAKDLDKLFQDNNFIDSFSQKINANIEGKTNMANQLQAMLTSLIRSGSEMSGATAGLEAFKASIMDSANVSPELAQALTLVISKMQELRGNTSSAAQSLTQFDKQTKMINNIKGMADRFLGLYQIIGFIKKGFHEMTTTIKELDTVMNGISIVTNMSTSDLWNQVDAYSKMAQQYGVSIKGAYEVSKIYYQQGLQTNDVMTLTEETLKLSKISGLDYATTTDYMTTALRGFKMEMTDASKVVDVYSNLAANTAVSQQELAEAMTRTASSMESVGATFEETSAMIATMVAVTRESASNIGSAMKSIASRYGELTKDPTKLIDEEGEQMDFNKVDTALRSIGISMHTADGQFREFTEVILELADAWKTLDSTQQRYVATQFAGNRQQSRFLALVSNGDLLRQNLQVAENSDDVGTTQALKALDSIETKIIQVTNAWQQFYLNIGLEDVWKGALTGITNVLNTLNEMPKVLGKIPVVAIGIIANSISLIRALINGGIAQISGFIVNRGQSTGVQTGQAMGEGMMKAFEPFLRAIADKLGMELPAALTSGVSSTEQLNSSMSKVANITRMAASAVSMLGLALNDGTRPAEELSGWITGLAGGAQAIVGLLLTLHGGAEFGIPLMLSSISSIAAGAGLIIETIEEKVERLTKEAETLSNTAKQLKTDEKNVQTLIDKYYQLEKTRYDSEEAAQEFQNVVNEIADTFPDLINGFDGLGNATIEATQLEETLAAVRRKTAQATLEAAQKEREKAEADAEQAQKNLKEAQQGLTGANTQIQSESYWSQRILGPMANYLDTKPKVKNLIDNTTEARNDNARLRLLIDKGYSNLGYNPKLKLFDEAGGGISGAKAVLDSLSETDDFRKILESYIDYYGDSSNSLKELSTQLTNAMSQGDTAQAFKVAQQFRTAYTSATKSEQDWYQTLYEKIDAWQEASLTLDQTNTELQSANLAEVSALAGTALTDFTYTEQQLYSGLTSLATSNLLSMFKSRENTDQTSEEWYKALGDNNPMEQIKNLIPELISQGFNFEEFNKVLLDTKHYGSSEEVKNALKLNNEEFSTLNGLLQTYYENIGTNYKNQASGAIEQAKAKRTQGRQDFFTRFETIVDDNNNQVNSYLEQSAINGLLQYEQLIAKTATNRQLESAGTSARVLVEKIDQINPFLADKIISNGFTTVEGFQESIDLLEQSEGYDTNAAAQRIVARLKEMQKLLSENLTLALQAQIDAVYASIDEAQGYASKAFSGVSSLEDARKMLGYFNKYRGDKEQLTVKDLNYFDGKYTLKNAQINVETLQTELNKELKETQSVLKEVQDKIGIGDNAVEDYVNSIIWNADSDKKLLQTILATDYDKYFDVSGKLLKDVNLDNLIADFKTHWADLQKTEEELTNASAQVGNVFEDLFASQDTISSVMKDIAANPTQISRETANRLKELSPDLFEKLNTDMEQLGIYVLTYEDLLEALQTEEVKNSMTPADYKTLVGQVKEAQRKSSEIYAQAEIAKNFDSITTDMLVAWAIAGEKELKDIEKDFTQQANGYWTYNGGDVAAYITKNGLTDNEIAQKAIGDALISQQKAIKDFYSSMINSITKGEQKIEKTAKTKAIFESLKEAGYNIVEQYGYYIVNLSRQQIQGLIAQISADNNLEESEKTELITSLNNTLKTYSFQEIFSNTLANYASLTYDQADKLVKGMSDELGFETSIDKLVEQGILSYNEFTGTYKANLDKLIELYNDLEQLGINQNEEASNTIRAQIAQLEHDTSWTTVVENFVSSSGSITYKMIGELLNAALENGIEGLTFESIEQYLTNNGKGFDIKDVDLSDLLTLLGIKTEQQTKIIAESFTQRIGNVISSFGNISSQITSGFSDFTQMQKIVDELQVAGYQVNFDSVFEYSEALHTWVYTQTGIMTRIAQLKEQLKALIETDQESEKLIQAEIDKLTQQQADSINIMEVMTTKPGITREKKRQELIKQINDYNSIVEEGKRITAAQINAIFSGNIEVAKQVYAALGRDFTLDDQKTILTYQYQEFLDMESELDAQVGDIVSDHTKALLEAYGYEFKEGTNQITKTNTSKLKQIKSNYLQNLFKIGLKSVQDVNQSIVEAWGEQYKLGERASTIISSLQNANKMSISDLANLAGINEAELSGEKLNELVRNGSISLLGGENIRINNWNKLFTSLVGNIADFIDTSSEAYIEAYGEYLDGQIAQHTKIHDQATSLLSKISEAREGDLINIKQLDQELDGQLSEVFRRAGANVTDGVATIDKYVNLNKLWAAVGELLNNTIISSTEYLKLKSERPNKIAAFSDVINSWDNISYQAIDTLAKSIGIDTEILLRQAFKSNGRNGYISQYSPEGLAKFLSIDDKYTQQNIDSWLNSQEQIFNNIANSAIASITNGPQVIERTDANAAILDSLEGGLINYDDELHGYIIDISNKTIDDAIAIINGLTLSGSERDNAISQIFSAYQEKSVGNILSSLISGRENLDYNLMNRAKTLKGFNEEMLKYNEATGEWGIGLESLKNLLEANRNKLDTKTFNTLTAQVKQADFDSTIGIAQQVFTSSTISEDLMAKFITAFGNKLGDVNLEHIFAYADGNYTIADFAGAKEIVEKLGLEADQVIAEVFNQRIQGFTQNFNTITSQATSGFGNYGEVQAALKEINKTFTIGGKQYKFNFDADTFAEYDDNLHTWVLSQAGLEASLQLAITQLRENNVSYDEIEQIQRQNLQQFGSQLDFASVISSIGTPNFSKLYNNLAKQINIYNKMVDVYNRNLADTDKAKKEYITQEAMEAILSGGPEAIQALGEIYNEIGQTLTQDDVTAAYRGPMTQIIAAKDNMEASVGDVLSNAAAQLLEASGYIIAENIEGTDYSIIKSIDISRRSAAYRNLYNQMAKQKGSNQNELNELLLSSWDAMDEGENQAIDTLGKALSMTYREFGESLIGQGVQLSIDTLDQYIKEGIIEKIGGGKIRITDFSKYAEKLGYDYNSEEYQKAYSEYIDNEIERQTKARKDIVETIDNVLNAKVGDQLNLSTIANQFGSEVLKAIGGEDLLDGILTIHEDSNILEIASSIAEAAHAKGLILESDMVELGEKIQEAIESYISAISQGIIGGLKGSQVNQIKEFADQFLGKDFFKQADFVQTAKGFQLTSDAAIRYYDALKKTGNYDTSEMFDKLQERILNRDNIETMNGIVGHIEELGRKIVEANNQAASSEGAKSEAAKRTAQALERELQLYKEIASTSQFNNPESYDFMGKNLPDMFQGPINYWDSMSQMASTLQASSKSGQMGVREFYNIATELGNLSAITGQQLEFYGKSFGTGAEAAANLIEQGFSNLENVDGKGAMINLKGIGVNIESGLAGMSEGIDKGMHEAAQSQIKMLDGLIAFLESIIAMESLGELDSDFNGEFSFNELFVELEGGLAQSNKDAQRVGKELLDKVDANDKLKKQFQQVQVGETSLYQILEDITSGEKIDKALAEKYTQMMSALYKASQSQDFTADSIPSILAQYSAGLDWQVELEDSTILYNHNGKTYKGDKNTDFSALIHKDVVDQVKKDLREISGGAKPEKLKGKDAYEIKLKTGGKMTVDIGKDNKLTASYNGKTYTGDTLSDIQSQIVSDYTRNHKNTTAEQAKIALGFEAATDIKWVDDAKTTVSQFSELTRSVVSGMLSSGKSAKQVVEQIQADYTNLSKKKFESKYGFYIDKKDEGQLQTILEELTKEQEVQLNLATIPGTEVPIEGPVPVTLTIKAVNDPNGLLKNYKIGVEATGSNPNVNSFGTPYIGNYFGELNNNDNNDSIQNQILGMQLLYGLSNLFGLGKNNKSTGQEVQDLSTLLWNFNNKNNQLQVSEEEVSTTGSVAEKSQIDKIISSGNYNGLLSPSELIGLRAQASLLAIQDTFSGNEKDIATNFDTQFNQLLRAALEKKLKIVNKGYEGTNSNTNNAISPGSEEKPVYQKSKGKHEGPSITSEEEDEKNRLEAEANRRNARNKADRDAAERNAKEKSSEQNLAEQDAAARRAAEQAAAKRAAEEAATKIEEPIGTQEYNELLDSEYNSYLARQGEINKNIQGLILDKNAVSELSKSSKELRESSAAFEEEQKQKLAEEQEQNAKWHQLGQTDLLQGAINANNQTQIVNGDSNKDNLEINSTLKDIETEVKETTTVVQEQEQQAQQEQKQQKEYTQEQQQFFNNWSSYLNNPSLFDVEKQDKFAEDYNNAFDANPNLSFYDAFDAVKEQLDSLSGAISGISAPVAEVTNTLGNVSGAANTATAAFNTTATAMSNLKSRNIDVDVNVRVNTTITGNGSADVEHSITGATGNIALAAGTKTLLGELGPELVVSNGRYFIAGQNGAEFVNLDKDAIVFNHLQTQRLLSNGSSGRGKAITNERNATSMATGNVRGPAKASASAVLTQLKQLRAMWQSIADLSVSDLAAKGGGGGGGGGNKQIAGFVRDVERWYNWLQKIADLEKKINYEEQLRSKLQSDMVANGKANYASQKRTYKDARDSAITSQSLALSQEDYFNKRRKQLNNSPLGKLYTFDESGQLHYKEGSYKWLANLFTTDDYGNQKYSSKQQYEKIIAKNPKFAKYMQYDESGKKINRKDYKSEDEYYQAMVKAFSDRMDSEKEEMQQLFDSFNEQQQAVLEQEQRMNEQLQAMKDNQMELENSVLDAIVDMRERAIEEMQNTRDALEESNQAFIEGLRNQLDKERDMYKDNENDQELQRNRRQLAILQRSGGSAEQIASLQQKIQQQSQEAYFDKQQEQIDSIQEASDLQIERLDRQIEIAQEQLEYEQAHGLLWGQVYEVMQQSPEKITQFITENTSDFWSASPIASSEQANEILFKAQSWTEFRKDADMQKAALGQINQDLEVFLGAMKQIYGKDANWKQIEKTAAAKYESLYNTTSDPKDSAWNAYKAAGKQAKEEPPKNELGDGGKKDNNGKKDNKTGTSNAGRTDKEATWSYNETYHYHKQWNGKGAWTMADKEKHDFNAGTLSKDKKTITKTCKTCKYSKIVDAPQTGTSTTDTSKTNTNTNTSIIDPKTVNKLSNGANSVASQGLQRKLELFASGGKNDYTGFAILHGTPTEPEGILNAEEYKAWKSNIKTTNLLYSALASISATQQNAAAAVGSITTNDSGINIENAVVNMNTTIANDYDARRAGEQALEQMITIARKSGTRSVARR